METGEHKQKNGRVIRKTSIAGYKNLLKNINDFQEYAQKIYFIRDYDCLKTQREKKAENKYWNKFYFEFTEFLYVKKNGFDNYVGTQIKLLRAFFNYLASEQILTLGHYIEFFYVVSEDIPVVALAPEQLNFLIFNKEFENALSKRLRIIKDMFVFGCFTALRFSDLTCVKRKNLEQINKNTYLVISSIKTGIPSRVLLPSFICDIINRDKRRKVSIFPPISKVNFNIALKQICLKAGWTHEVMKKRNKRGIPSEILPINDSQKSYRFCDLVSSHLMRRTAITTMLRLGMHETNVRLISGHKPNSKSFYRYVYVADSFMDEVLDAMHEKLKKMNYE